MKILMLGSECQHYTLKRKDIDQLAYVPPKAEPGATPDYFQRSLPSQVRVFDTLREALDQFAPDLAVIGIPNTTKNQFEIEKQLIDRQVPILEFKLRLARIEDLRDFLAYRAASDTPVYIGEHYVCRACIRQLRRDIASWDLGKPEYLRWVCNKAGGGSDWMKTYEHISLEDLGLHHLNILHSLFDLGKATIQTRSLSPKKGGGLRGTICESWLAWPDGFCATHTIDWVNALEPNDWLGTIALECERGGALIKDERIYLAKWGEEAREIPVTLDPIDPLEEMIALLKENRQPEAISPIAVFATVMETIDGALRGKEGK